MATNQGMAISLMVKLSEYMGQPSPPSDKSMGLSASCLFLGSESDDKYVKLEWNFEDPVNLIDWIGLFQQNQCNPLLYMDYKSYGVCGAKAGSVDWKVTNAHLNALNNNNSLCFRYYDGLTGALRASSPPLLVYSDAQVAITSIVCKQLPEAKSAYYYAKVSSSATGCQYKTPLSANGYWQELNYLFPADRSSELKFAIKERVNHWSKRSSNRVLGVVNIAVLDMVQSANQDLAFVLRPLPSSTANSPAFIYRHTSSHRCLNHCQIVVSCRLQPQQQQSYHDTLCSLRMPQPTKDLNSINNNGTKSNEMFTKPSENRLNCTVNKKSDGDKKLALVGTQDVNKEISKGTNESILLSSNSMISSESSENTTSPSSICSDSLPSTSASLLSNQPSTSSSNSLSSISNLPPGWEVRVHRNGRLIYIDHVNKRTTWHAPVILESYMPNGSEEDAENKQYICARRTVTHNDESERTERAKHLLCPTNKSDIGIHRSEKVFSTKPKAVKFLQRQDFSRLLFANEKALHLYNQSTYLKHIIQRIRHDPTRFEVFERNRELVEFLNMFADRTQPLPAGWQTARHSGTVNNEQKLFIDHKSRKITLIDPRLPEEIKQRRARSAPPTRRLQLDVGNDLNGNAIWDVVNRVDEIQTLLAERLPEIAPKVCKKLKIISRIGEAALIRFANDMDLITAISVLDQTTKPAPANEFEKKLTYFYSSLQRAGYGQGPGKIRFRLRRNQLMNDAYEKILAVDPVHLKKYHMTVTFDEEDGLDYGGPSRELFFLLSRELFNPYYGLFEYSANDTYTVQMSPMSKFVDNHLQWMELCGRILGLALIHRCLIDTFFTRAFYKFLLRLPYTISDLQSMDQQFYTSLKWIRENPITPDLELTFNATEEVAGEIVEKELLPGGRDIAVTEYNKEEYITLLLKWRMESSVEEQGKALLRGLHSIIDKDYLLIFDSQQLELVLSGTVEIDIEDWQENTEYKGGYYDGHVVISWFWQTVYSMCNAERLKLLQFVTGTSSIPFEGFQALRGSNGLKKFTIEKWGSEESLPRAHTCFNRLDLPAYPTQHVLLTKLKLAINESSCYAIE